MKKALILALLALVLCLGAAMAEETDILGQPFPDFTAVDTDGNAFTLSEALQDHEAVLVNIWATWCPPCEAEMPYLNEAYAQYGDRVAFIALSCDAEDTAEKIEAYRQAHGLDFPMGQDEGALLYQYLGDAGIPTTAIVDRFGNTAFVHFGRFSSAGEVERVIEAFLGDGYTQTVPLTRIPKDTATRAFQVSEATAIRVENEDMKPIIIRVEGSPEPEAAFVIDGDTAHLRIEVTASDDPSAMVLYNDDQNTMTLLSDLLDAQHGTFVCDVPMPSAQSDRTYVYVCVVGDSGDGEILCNAFLIPGDGQVERFMDDMRAWGYSISWEYGDPAPAKNAAPQAYTLHVVDQDGEPVPGVTVLFCSDTACTPLQSDDSGTVTFDGAPDAYHVQLLEAPEGYGFDPDFDMTTSTAYGEWALRIRKDY